MPTDLAPTAVVLLTTYWLHSSLLLGAAWLVTRASRMNSHALAERVWKLAAVLPLATATAQWAGGFSGLPFDLSNRADQASERAGVSEREPTGGARDPGPVRSASISNSDGAFGALPIESAAPPEPAHVFDSLDAAASDWSSRDLDLRPGADAVPGAIAADMAASRAPTPAEARALADSDPAATASRVVPDREGPSASRPRLSPAAMIFGTVATLCVLLGIVRLIGQGLIFRRRLAGARVLKTGPAHRELERLLRRTGSRSKVVLLASATFAEPVAFGVIRRRIALPEGTESTLQADELRALVAHELAHLVRGDSLWLWIGRVLCSCLAFQPLNFLARRRWQEAEEHLCDDWAVRHGANDFALARCLARIAEWRLANRRPSAPALAAGGRRSSLAKRIERLVTRDRRREPWGTGLRRRVPVATALLLAVALVGFGPRAAVPGGVGILLWHGSPSRDFTTRSVVPLSASGHDANPAHSSLEEEWRLLDAELDRLDERMSRAGELLRAGPTTPEFGEIAARLESRMESLRQRRRAPPGP